MLKTKSYRFISLTMALLMFFSSAGVSMDMHFCQGKLKGVSFIGKAQNCHQKANHCKNSKKACHKKASSEDSSETDDCCNNKTTILQMDADLIPAAIFSFNNISLDLVFPTDNFIDNKTLRTTKVDLFKYYRPPPLKYDRRVLFQSFLC